MAAPDPSPRGSIGPYRIVARVGAGGMGEVFKAWDPRLEREVAIKLLHPENAASPERQKRLLAEGRAASALNHPNILRVYDADVDGTSYYLVSEWLEGKSLRDELSRGPLPLKRLLDLSVQVADGLAAAHSIGIVHRDIKPENVMLARDGTARIVDFGLARADASVPAMSAAIGQASTMSLEGGLSGTPAYMSPEQARGNAGDFRTDQFSFGALVYEMATGTHAFRRDSVADTLSAVLHEEPKSIAELNPRIPAAFRWVVEQCLAKDAAERYGATEDLARELRRVRDRLLEAQLDQKHDGDRPAALVGWKAIAAVGGAGVVGAAAAIVLLAPSAESSTPSFAPIATASQYEGSPAWSQDGQSLAYAADVDGVLQVFVRRLGDAVSRQVTQGRFDADQPFWAPDGQRLYFISLAGENDALWSVGVTGGRPELVIENVVRAAIDPKGQRLAMFRRELPTKVGQSLWWSSPPGAEPTKESRPPFDRRTTEAQLAFSSDGRLLAWMNLMGTITPGDTGSNDFYVVPSDNGIPRRVLHSVPITSSLPSLGWLPDARHVVLAIADPRLGNTHLWLADTESDDLRQLTATHTNETSPAVSPNGARIAYATDEVDFDVQLIAPDGRTRRSALATARNEFAPVWSSSGDQFAFVTDRSGSLEIWAMSRDGQWERPIVTAADFGGSYTRALGSLAFSPDGRTLAYQRNAESSFEVWLSPATGGAPIRLSKAGPGEQIYQDSPTWSPDGEWIAFTDSGGPRPRALKRIRVGTTDAVELVPDVGASSYSQARWSPDGRWIACQTADRLIRIPSEGGPPSEILEDQLIDFTWDPDSRRLHALANSDTSGHFALIEIDAMNGAVKTINPDLGPIPVAIQPIRGLSYAKGVGFLTSLASARSDIWLLEGFQPHRSGLSGLLQRFGWR